MKIPIEEVAERVALRFRAIHEHATNHFGFDHGGPITGRGFIWEGF
jgi:hypothetical protein